MNNDTTLLMRHFLSTIEYRFHKCTMSCTDRYSSFEIGYGTRTPTQIVNHMTHVLMYALSNLNNSEVNKIHPPPVLIWEKEIERFIHTLNRIDDIIKSDENHDLNRLKTILQGPLSDVMTHIGQLAMLSRIDGNPIVRENFMKAKID